MRITFLLTQSLASPSGLGRYWPLSQELVRLGHEVTILALHHDFRALKQHRFTVDGVRVCYAGQMHVSKRGDEKHYFGLTRLLWVVTRSTWQLMWLALQTPTDVYHLGKPHPMNGLAGMLAHLIKRKPVFLDCDDYEAASNRFGQKWQKQVVAFFENHLPAFATGITVNTDFTLKRLQALNYPAERIVLVPNGVDRRRFSDIDLDAVATLRGRLGLAENKVVVYVGSLSLASHPLDLLLEAFAVVQRAEPKARLLIVGGGEDIRVLQRQAEALKLSDHTLFAGRVPPDTVPLYYRLADVTVDPVYDDPAGRARSPLKVVESLASGTPVATGDVGDRSLLLARGGGILVSPGDASALAEGMLAILQDRALQRRLARETLRVRERYYWDRLVRDFVKVYKGVA